MTQATRFAVVRAKIGVERGKLLTDTKLKALARSRSLDEFATQLAETPYKETISRINPPINSRKLEYVLREKLIETYARIFKYSPRKILPLLEWTLTGFEVENLKTLIKGIAARFTTEEKIARIHLSAEEPLKSRAIFEQAAKATDFRTLIEVLKPTRYLTALTMGLKRSEQTGSTQSFDILIDKEYHEQIWSAFQKLPNKEKKHALFYASMENDSYTLLTVLREKILNYSPDSIRLSLPSTKFKIQKKTIEDMISAPDFESALKIAQKTYGSTIFGEGPTPEETVANAQRSFRKELYKHAYSSIIRENFTIEAPLALMVQKEIETRNLEAIALGIENASKPEDIESTLILHG